MSLNTDEVTGKKCSCEPEVEPTDVMKIVDKHHGGRSALISILEDVQAKYGYLPAAALRLVAERTRSSLADVYGVATFYRSFSLKPRGEHQIAVCVGTACHVRGGPAVAEEFERHLGIGAGETTSDRKFSLETVNCLGACALGPIVLVDGHYFSHVKRADVRAILEKVESGLDVVDVTGDRRLIPLVVKCSHCDHSLMDAEHLLDNCPSISTAAAYDGKKGYIRLSSLYGSYMIEADVDIPDGSAVEFFCPNCNASLLDETNCPECDAPMISMAVDGGGMVQSCSRRGCKDHTLDLSGVFSE